MRMASNKIKGYDVRRTTLEYRFAMIERTVSSERVNHIMMLKCTVVERKTVVDSGSRRRVCFMKGE